MVIPPSRLITSAYLRGMESGVQFLGRPEPSFLFTAVSGSPRLAKAKIRRRVRSLNPNWSQISFRSDFSFKDRSIAYSLFNSDCNGFFRRSPAGIFILATISIFAKLFVLKTSNRRPTSTQHTSCICSLHIVRKVKFMIGRGGEG